MDRRKFILGSILTTFSISTNAMSPPAILQKLALKKRPTVDFLKSYLLDNLSPQQLQELYNYQHHVNKNKTNLENLIKDDFYSDQTMTVKGVLFSKSELSHLLYKG